MSHHPTQALNRAFNQLGAVAALLVLAAGLPAPARAQSTPLLGQFMYVSFNFPPKGFAFCNGQLMAISDNAALFSLLGTNYGGDGHSNFALPNMQGRVPVHSGQGPGLSNFTLGQTGGVESVSLTTLNMPAHVHGVAVTAQVPASSGSATAAAPAGANLANSVHTLDYSASAPNVSLGSTVTVGGSVGSAGSATPLPFSIVQPYTTLNCVIALEGIFPSRN